MARKRNVCRNPNVGFCVNKTMGGPGLVHKNVSKTSLFPTSGFWWRPRKKVCCDRTPEKDDTVLVHIELDMPFSELDLALLAQDLERFGAQLLHAWEGSSNALLTLTRPQYNILKQEIENANMSFPPNLWKQIRSSDEDPSLRDLLVCMIKHRSWAISSSCHSAVVAAFGQGQRGAVLGPGGQWEATPPPSPPRKFEPEPGGPPFRAPSDPPPISPH